MQKRIVDVKETTKDKLIYRTACISAITSCIVTLGFVTITDNKGFLTRKDVNKINAYVEDIKENYYDKVDENELRDNIYHSVFKVDKYSSYLDTKEYEDFKTQTDNFVGIGVGVNQRIYDNRIKITSIYPNSPAAEKDIQVGDIILEVDGIALKDKTLEEASNMIRGEENTTVHLTLLRQEDVIDVWVLRKALEYRVVESQMYDNIQYIKITEFFGEVPQQLSKVLNQDSDGLILDLRGNSGGDVNIMCQTASLLVPKDTLIAYSENNKGKRVDYYTSKDYEQIYKNTNIVILQDEDTASASEMLIGCLKDTYNAKLVGDTTYGKGVIQLLKISGNTAYKITTDKWFTPLGTCINEEGFSPDYRELDTDNQLKVALDLLR